MLPVYAHVRWFVDTATVAVDPYQLAEPIVLGAVMFGLIALTLATLLQPLEQRWWTRIIISEKFIRIARWVGFAIILFGVWFVHNWMELLPYLGYAGYIALLKKQPQFALAVLAAGVGLSLTLLAFDEKLLHPELAATFLLDHPWNFSIPIRTFILFAGTVELTLGLLITLGLAARLASIVVLLTLVVTAFALGLTELLGHVPIAAALTVFLLESTKIRPWSARLQ